MAIPVLKNALAGGTCALTAAASNFMYSSAYDLYLRYEPFYQQPGHVYQMTALGLGFMSITCLLHKLNKTASIGREAGGIAGMIYIVKASNPTFSGYIGTIFAVGALVSAASGYVL